MSAEEDIRRTIANSYDLNDWAPMESVLARREALGSREDVPKDCGRPSTVGAGFQPALQLITCPLPGFLVPGNA